MTFCVSQTFSSCDNYIVICSKFFDIFILGTKRVFFSKLGRGRKSSCQLPTPCSEFNLQFPYVICIVHCTVYFTVRYCTYLVKLQYKYSYTIVITLLIPFLYTFLICLIHVFILSKKANCLLLHPACALNRIVQCSIATQFL